jgi:hypothetical protein
VGAVINGTYNLGCASIEAEGMVGTEGDARDLDVLVKLVYQLIRMCSSILLT